MSDSVRPIDGSPPGPSVLGFSKQEYWSGLPFPIPMHACMLSRFSRVRLCETPWTVVQQVPLATGFSRQEYWHGMPFPSPQKHQINTEKHIDLLTSSLCDNVKSSNKKKSTLNIFFACRVIIFKHILVNGSCSESKI